MQVVVTLFIALTCAVLIGYCRFHRSSCYDKNIQYERYGAGIGQIYSVVTATLSVSIFVLVTLRTYPTLLRIKPLLVIGPALIIGIIFAIAVWLQRVVQITEQLRLRDFVTGERHLIKGRNGIYTVPASVSLGQKYIDQRYICLILQDIGIDPGKEQQPVIVSAQPKIEDSLNFEHSEPQPTEMTQLLLPVKPVRRTVLRTNNAPNIDAILEKHELKQFDPADLEVLRQFLQSHREIAHMIGSDDYIVPIAVRNGEVEIGGVTLSDHRESRVSMI